MAVAAPALAVALGAAYAQWTSRPNGSINPAWNAGERRTRSKMPDLRYFKQPQK
jgi:hypothetical protein